MSHFMGEKTEPSDHTFKLFSVILFENCWPKCKWNYTINHDLYEVIIIILLHVPREDYTTNVEDLFIFKE